MGVFQFSKLDFLFTCLGLLFLLLDIVLDVYAVVKFYQEKAYVSLSILVVLLLGSSVLVQTFSWLWYRYENFRRETKAENYPSVIQLKLLHVLQLGIYIRHAGVAEVSISGFFPKLQNSQIDKDLAVYLSHDLSMLRLIETFSESCPQIVLMLTIILQRDQLGPVPVLKALGSASAIAFGVTMYHRSLRSFLPDKHTQPLKSSVVYFLWNLFLISSRLFALALFASILPCFIFTHFICSWLVLFFFAWRSKTDFMDSAVGEWLYRATVGIIWYFNWFNVAEGKTRFRSLFYHSYILVDICLLCGLWCWKTITEPPQFALSNPHPIIIALIVVAFNVVGLFLKMIYYKFCHPNITKEQLKGESDEVDFPVQVRTLVITPEPEMTEEPEIPKEPEVKRCNKRMRKLAENFYS